MLRTLFTKQVKRHDFEAGLWNEQVVLTVAQLLTTDALDGREGIDRRDLRGFKMQSR